MQWLFFFLQKRMLGSEALYSKRSLFYEQQVCMQHFLQIGQILSILYKHDTPLEGGL